MKYTLLFVIIAFSCIVLLGQGSTIVLNENFENASLKEICETLEKKYQLQFAYDNESVQNITITQNIDNQPLSEALYLIFFNTPLAYQLVDNKQILIRKKITNEASLGQEQSLLIKGKIVDASDHSPLSFATVYCTPNNGSEADEEGYFALKIPFNDKQATIYAQYVGYETQKIVLNKNHIPSNLHIKLSTQIQEIASITIVDKVPLISQNQLDGAITMQTEKLSSLPAFVGGKDLFKSLQLLPGISAHDDLSAELSIRASNGDESMVVFDGITLYNVTHYFGIFSAINPNITDKVTVYKNAFPVEYGGRTAGIIDISSNKALQARASFGLESNLLTSNVWTEIPIGANMGLLFGGRITNKNIANTSLFDPLNQQTTLSDFLPNTSSQNQRENLLTQVKPNFQFNDFNLKWEWRISPKTLATASYFRGFDTFQYFSMQSASLRRNHGSVVNVNEEDTDWKNQGVSLQIEQDWNNVLQSKLTLSHSNYDNNQLLKTTIIKDKMLEKDTVFQLQNKQYNAINAWEINCKNDWQINTKNRLTFGYNFINSRLDLNIENTQNQVLNRNNTADQHAFFLEYSSILAEKLQLSVGLRQTWYTGTKQHYVSPRLSLSYAVDQGFKLKASASQYHQFLRKFSHEDIFGRNFDYWIMADDFNAKHFPVASSTNLMAGFQFHHDFFDLDVELYQKNSTGIVEHARSSNYLPSVDFNDTNNTISYKVFTGTGVTRGLDVLLKKTVGNYTAWIAYTLSKSTNSFSQINKGQPFPSKNDRRHQLKIIQQYQWNKWDFSATYVFSSGRPYTDLSILQETPNRRGEIPIKDRLSYLEDYHRVDVGINYNFPIKNAKAQLGLSIFNLFNRKNVKYRQYLFSIKGEADNGQSPFSTVLGTELDMLGITPNVSFRIRF